MHTSAIAIGTSARMRLHVHLHQIGPCISPLQLVRCTERCTPRTLHSRPFSLSVSLLSPWSTKGSRFALALDSHSHLLPFPTCHTNTCMISGATAHCRSTNPVCRLSTRIRIGIPLNFIPLALLACITSDCRSTNSVSTPA